MASRIQNDMKQKKFELTILSVTCNWNIDAVHSDGTYMSTKTEAVMPT